MQLPKNNPNNYTLVSKMSPTENKYLCCSQSMAHTFKCILHHLVQILTFVKIWKDTTEDNEDSYCCDEGHSLSIEIF